MQHHRNQNHHSGYDHNDSYGHHDTAHKESLSHNHSHNYHDSTHKGRGSHHLDSTHAGGHSHHQDNRSPLGKSLSEHTDVYEHLYSQDKPIHTTIYRNGDHFDAGIAVVVTRSQFKNWLNFLDYLTDRLNLAEGAVHNVYTLTGEEVRHFKHLKQHGVYVGAHGEFKRAEYGGKDTHRTRWRIRQATARVDPSAVMSKESRELYLQQKGFKPKVDDVWDDPHFDTKNVHPKHQHIQPHKAHKDFQRESVAHHRQQQHHVTKHNASSHNANNANHAVRPSHNWLSAGENAYRISDKGKAAPAKTATNKSTNKSRFPPIHSGSLVEMNKSKTDKVNHNAKASMKSRSSSAPENLHNKNNAKTKKIDHTAATKSSKSISSEPKNFNSQIKKPTTVTKPTAKHENKNSLKPPGGKSTTTQKSATNGTTKGKKELQRINSPSVKSVGNKSLLPVQQRQSRSRSPSQNSYRERTPATGSNTRKRNRSADYDGRSQYSERRPTPRASSLDEEYYERERTYEDEEYYRGKENGERNRRNSYYEKEYDEHGGAKEDDEGDYGRSRSRGDHSSRRRSTHVGDERLYEANDRNDDDYYKDRDYYKEENGYEEDDGYYREPTPKPVSKNNKKQSDQEETTKTGAKLNSKNSDANREKTPPWANKLHLAVRDLATEVHNLSDSPK